MARKILSATAVRCDSTARWIGSSHVSNTAALSTKAAVASATKMTASHVRSRRRAKKLAGVSGGSQWRQRAGAAPGRIAPGTLRDRREHEVVGRHGLSRVPGLGADPGAGRGCPRSGSGVSPMYIRGAAELSPHHRACDEAHAAGGMSSGRPRRSIPVPTEQG